MSRRVINQVYDFFEDTSATTITLMATDESGLYIYDSLVVYADYIDDQDILDFVKINQENYITMEEGDIL